MGLRCVVLGVGRYGGGTAGASVNLIALSERGQGRRLRFAYSCPRSARPHEYFRGNNVRATCA